MCTLVFRIQCDPLVQQQRQLKVSSNCWQWFGNILPISQSRLASVLRCWWVCSPELLASGSFTMFFNHCFIEQCLCLRLLSCSVTQFILRFRSWTDALTLVHQWWQVLVHMQQNRRKQAHYHPPRLTEGMKLRCWNAVRWATTTLFFFSCGQ